MLGGPESRVQMAELTKFIAMMQKKFKNAKDAGEARKWAVQAKSAQAIHDVIQFVHTSGLGGSDFGADVLFS